MKASRPRASNKQIRAALIGVGNVASVFVQTLSSRKTAGIWHESVAGYKPKDIRIVAAFDVDARKVGEDLSEAIFQEPNVSPRFVKEIDPSSVIVQPGVIVGDETSAMLSKKAIDSYDFQIRLEESKPDIVINLLPSGMQKTSLEYAKASLRASAAFINATPAKLAANKTLRRKFASSGLLLVGDDMMSQFGGTAFHKGILEFMNRRGLKIRKSYQLDVGGGNETLRTIEENVKQEKRSIKTRSISGEIPYPFQTVAGTTDYVDYLGNNRTSYFWIQASTLFDSEVKIDVYLRTNDGANATNILLDVIRASAYSTRTRKFALSQTICDYGFKSLVKPSLLRDAQDNFLSQFNAK